MNLQLINTGIGVITLHLVDGSKFHLRPGFWVEVDQNGSGLFLRIVRRGCVVLP